MDIIALTQNQLIERIWLLFQEDLKPRNVSLHDWWHTSFKADAAVLDLDTLRDKLSQGCGDILAGYLANPKKIPKKIPEEISEEISAIKKKAGLEECQDFPYYSKKCEEIMATVLQKKDSELGFSWKFADQEQDDDTIIEAKEQFKELICLCNKLLKA